MKRFLTATATTKRSPGIVGGKRGAPTTFLSSFACTPLNPADGQTARDLAFRVLGATQAPYKVLEAFVDSDLDIIEGDMLIIGGREYPIRGVDVWPWRRGQTFLHLLVEDTYIGQSRVVPVDVPLLDFSDADNSQYVGLI